MTLPHFVSRCSFYLPHGITTDKENNYWVTDVALHQVRPGEGPLQSGGQNCKAVVQARDFTGNIWTHVEKSGPTSFTIG